MEHNKAMFDNNNDKRTQQTIKKNRKINSDNNKALVELQHGPWTTVDVSICSNCHVTDILDARIEGNANPHYMRQTSGPKHLYPAYTFHGNDADKHRKKTL